MWVLDRQQKAALIAAMILAFVGSIASAQVRAEMFEVGKPVAADNFNVALEKLADKWEGEALYYPFHDGMTDRQLFGAHAEVKTLERCAKELREVISREKEKDAKTDTEADLFNDARQSRAFEVVAVQEQDFGQLPPQRPQPQPDLKPMPVPSQVPQKHIQVPQKNVQAPAMVCAPGTTCGTTYVNYRQPVYGTNVSYGQPQGGGLFPNWRARRQARQAMRQSNRGGRFGGC